MKYIYVIRVDIISNEADNTYTVYGVEAIDTRKGTVLSSYPDIFTDLKEAESVIQLLNEEKLDIIHLPDVINDIITKAHT